ncbi:hypothetical protein IFM89_020280 [Coptis chinensis]|uniref:O-methyltransferase C-terminal domain-containing protein n=1 Tax=Coptis chinensis TaxID=261450 RepID=A0A835LVV1_9MAGN|nr:hypothetical protein IFM89_020280 [Coptis chinensis]
MSSIQNFNYLTPEEEEEACLYAMQLCNAANLPMVLKAAIELDVFEIIAKFGHAFMNLDDGRVERLYGLAPVCKFFIRNEDGVSLAPLALTTMSQVFIQSWYYLNDAVVDGGSPFNICHGMTLFDYIGRDPITSKLFNTGMSVHSKLQMKMILQIYKGFEGLKTVVDVGGGTGATINMIVEKHPLVKGINFDLPHAIKDAPAYLEVYEVEKDAITKKDEGWEEALI